MGGASLEPEKRGPRKPGAVSRPLRGDELGQKPPTMVTLPRHDAAATARVRSDSTEECVVFLVQAFPGLSRDTVERKLIACDYDVGLTVVELESLVAQQARAGPSSSASAGAASTSTAQQARAGPSSSASAGAGPSTSTRSFAKVLQESPKPTAAVRQTRQLRRTNKEHRRWWQEIDEFNIFAHFAGSGGSEEKQDREAKEASEDDKLSFLESIFSGEIEPFLILDVLTFCRGDVDRSTQVLMRMMQIDEAEPKWGWIDRLLEHDDVGSTESDQPSSSSGAGEEISAIRSSFPRLDESIIRNALDFAAGSVSEALGLLSLEYETGDGGGSGSNGVGHGCRAPEGGNGGDQGLGGWKQVVNQGKQKTQLRSLRELFPGCEPDFAEDVLASFSNDLEKTVEYLTREGYATANTAGGLSMKQMAKTQKSAASVFNRDEDDRGHYSEYRDRASACDAAMRTCFDQASKAFNSGYMKKARLLSQKGMQMRQERNEWSQMAAEKTAKRMNRDRLAYFLDLHGLRVDEALMYLDKILQSVDRVPGKKVLHVITGVGRGSAGGISRLKPAVEGFLTERGLYYEVPDSNPGEYHVHLKGTQ